MDRAESIVISILRPLEAGVYTIDYTIDVRDRRGRQAGNGEWPEDNIAIASNANVRLYSRSSDERSRDGSMSGDSTGARAQSSRARAVAAHAANDKEASEADDVQEATGASAGHSAVTSQSRAHGIVNESFETQRPHADEERHQLPTEAALAEHLADGADGTLKDMTITSNRAHSVLTNNEEVPDAPLNLQPSNGRKRKKEWTDEATIELAEAWVDALDYKQIVKDFLPEYTVNACRDRIGFLRQLGVIQDIYEEDGDTRYFYGLNDYTPLNRGEQDLARAKLT